jgi:hypothetical protein
MPDYLTKRNGYWQFVRRVPLEYAHLDERVVIKHSTKVAVRKDRRGIKAGKVADAMNRELVAYWIGLSEGKPQEATDRYNEAKRSARLRSDYVETAESPTRPTLEVLERLERLEKLVTGGLVEDAGARAALLGYEKRPSVKLSEVFSKFENQTRNEVKDMSPNQLKRRKKDFMNKLLTNKQLANKQIAVQPIAPVLVNNLVGLAKAFAKAADIKITTVGTNSTKTASFYTDLESGETSCTLRKYDLLTAWFAANWPEGHTMPTLEDPQHYP